MDRCMFSSRYLWTMAKGPMLIFSFSVGLFPCVILIIAWLLTWVSFVFPKWSRLCEAVLCNPLMITFDLVFLAIEPSSMKNTLLKQLAVTVLVACGNCSADSNSFDADGILVTHTSVRSLLWSCRDAASWTCATVYSNSKQVDCPVYSAFLGYSESNGHRRLQWKMQLQPISTLVPQIEIK